MTNTPPAPGLWTVEVTNDDGLVERQFQLSLGNGMHRFTDSGSRRTTMRTALRPSLDAKLTFARASAGG